MGRGKGCVLEEGFDGVVYAEAGLGPGEDAEEDGILWEEGDVFLELGADVRWSKGAD